MAIEDLNKLLDTITDGLHNSAMLHRVGLGAIRIIKERTRLWKDVDGKTFEPYTDAWAEVRTDKGLPVKAQGTNTDSMMVFDPYDGMMSKIEHTLAADLSTVTLDITSEAKKKLAYYHNVSGVGAKGKHLRKFWGLNEQTEVPQIAEIIEQNLQETLDKFIMSNLGDK